MAAAVRARVAFLSFVLCSAPAAFPQQPAQTVRVVRVATGPDGAIAGDRYILSEERSVFRKGRDRQVVVVFEWEGTVGRYKLGATWTNLDTLASTSSQFDHEASRPQFGAYWTLPIADPTPLGRWRLEATVDGRPAGSVEFQILAEDAASVAASRRVLSQSELYERLSRGTVVLERRSGRDVVPTAGVVLPGNRVATLFSSVDAAETIDIVLPSGGREPVTSLAEWDRHADWAILSTSFAATPLQSGQSPAVGDRCFSLATGTGGSVALVEGTVSGHQQSNAAPARLFATFFSGAPSPGAPIVNDNGELIGMAGRQGPYRFAESVGATRLTRETPGTPVMPAAILQRPSVAVPTTRTELISRGVLTAALRREENVLSGGFATRVQHAGPNTRPLDERREFSVNDNTIVVFVSWAPQQQVKGMVLARLFDDENHTIVSSKPSKLNLKPGTLMWTDWKIPVPIKPGSYRVDVMIDDVPAWRGYFTVAR